MGSSPSFFCRKNLNRSILHSNNNIKTPFVANMIYALGFYENFPPQKSASAKMPAISLKNQIAFGIV